MAVCLLIFFANPIIISIFVAFIEKD